ncbi:MAG TPA: hypothetical protein PJ987_11430 [Bacteroidia bacterium]|nr:hypothetical protein [Bacteroidia bacterium]HMY43555.1 hypothetical protein [Chitinophagales bacterium]
MENVQNVVESNGFLQLHPAVQCTTIIVGALAVSGFYLALFTDFWDNISRRK